MGKFKLTKEKKRMLKVLILKKAQEDLAREQAEKDAAKFEAIGEIVPPLDIEGYEEEDLIEKCKTLYTWVMESEEKRLGVEYGLMKQDFDMNELTLSVNEGTGKFMKPQLKRVNKTAAKIKKSSGDSDSAKAAAFRSGLKASTNPDQKFDLGEEKEKPAFGADALGKKKKKGEGATATESAGEAPPAEEAAAE
jgi:hypothetical protein